MVYALSRYSYGDQIYLLKSTLLNDKKKRYRSPDCWASLKIIESVISTYMASGASEIALIHNLVLAPYPFGNSSELCIVRYQVQCKNVERKLRKKKCVLGSWQ